MCGNCIFVVKFTAQISVEMNKNDKNTSALISSRFSIFPTGWKDEANNKVVPRQNPQQTQTIDWVYEYIISDRARWATMQLREIAPTATREETQDFKVLNFMYATFSGIFTYRRANRLVRRSPFITIDIDHLNSLDQARRVRDRLIADKMVETALCFISPSGQGVKWIVSLPEWTEGLPFKKQFDSVQKHVEFQYGIVVDSPGSDVCRACFLPWDPECYVNEKYIIYKK